jgi:RNA polymerase sigma-70 factor (ECF subfamily)
MASSSWVKPAASRRAFNRAPNGPAAPVFKTVHLTAAHLYGCRTSSVRALSVADNEACPQTGPMTTLEQEPANFDDVVLPHLDAAYRLARWLVRNEHDAEDVLQEASLRAFRYFRTFTGGNGRAWFLTIVRNTCRGWRARSVDASTDPFDEEQHGHAGSESDPEAWMLRVDDMRLIERAMRHVPRRVRELLVLREIEGLSYRELAAVMHMPMGTVMSSLSRARKAFRGAMNATVKQNGIPRQHILAYARQARYGSELPGADERRRD